MVKQIKTFLHRTMVALAVLSLGLLTSCNPLGDDPTSSPTFLNPSTNLASLSISDGPSYDFGTQGVNTTVEKVFTVINSGNLLASDLGAQGLSSPFAFKGGSYPGTGGTCGTTLSALGSCTLVVVFSPTIVGSFSDTVSLTYNDGQSSRFVTRTLMGASENGAFLNLSDGPSFDFGSQFLGSTTEKTFTITNSGNIPATFMGDDALIAPFSYKGGTYPGTGGDCGVSLDASGTCTVVVTYQPTSAILSSELIHVNYQSDATEKTASRSVSGTGKTPATLAVSDGATYDFGTQYLNTTTDKTFTVTNSGNVSATSIAASALAGPFVFKGGSFPGTAGTCVDTLGASSSCTVVVSFQPTQTGVASTSIQLSYNNGQSSQTSARAMAGTGKSVADITLSDGPTYNYGTKFINTSTDKVFTLTNGGGSSATGLGAGAPALSAPFQFKGGNYPGTNGTCGSTLASSASCTVIVTYSPTVVGVSSDTLRIAYNDGQGSQTISNGLAGTAQAPASLTLSDSPSYSFGTKFVNSSTDKTFTLTNSGGVSATSIAASLMSLPFAFKGGSFPGTGGDCSATLSASSSCSIVVTYRPTSVGSFSSSLQLTYQDGQTAQTTSRAISGDSTTPASLSISDGAANSFGTRFVNTTTQKTFTVTNSGGSSATLMAAGTPALAAPFSYVGSAYPGTGGTCGLTLSASGTCTLEIQFSPTTAEASFGDTIRVSYADGQTTRTATQSISGAAQNRALLSISDGPTYNYGNTTVDSYADKTFTVSNSGDVSANSIVTSLGTALFSVTGGTCGSSLGPSSSCTVIVRFSPVAAGAFSDALNLTYDDGVDSSLSVSVNLQGTGLTPAVLSFSDGASYDYHNAAVNGYLEHTFSIQNTGQSTATVMAAGTPALAAPFTFKGGSYPGTGGTCAATLASGATCTVIARFSPTQEVISSDTLRVSYNDGATAQTASIGVSGTGVQLAFLLSMNDSTFDFGTKSVNSSTEGVVTITNSGVVIANSMVAGVPALAPPFSFKGGSYPGTGGTCSTSLAAGTSCTVVLLYNPTASGAHSGILRISYDNSSNTETLEGAVVGGTPAILSISDGPTYPFGNQYVGYTSEKTFTVNNAGGSPATAVTPSTLSSPFSFKGGTYPGTGGTCGSTIAVGSSCSVVVNFSPSSTGAFSGNLNLSYGDGITDQNTSVTMTGTGLGPAVLTVSDGPTYDFGTQLVGSSTDKTFTISNTGQTTASSMAVGTPAMAAPFSFKGGSYPGTGGTCGTSLGGSSNCTVVVTYSPSSSGTFSDNLRIQYNNGASTVTSTRALSGTATGLALLTISDGPTYDFGTQFTNSNTEKTFTITNIGQVAASSISQGTPNLSSPFAFKGGAYPGTGGTCSTSLGASSTCTIVVVFSPLSAEASFNGTLKISYNDGATSQNSTIALIGASQNPALLSISDGTTFDFGSLTTNTTGEKIFVVTNSGDVSATSLGADTPALALPFRFKGGSYPGTDGTCGSSLSSWGSCSIVVTFSPTSAGSSSDTVRLSYVDGQVTQSATRPISGTGLTPAVLSISDGPTYSYGSQLTNSSTDKTFTVTNSGGSSATLIDAGTPALAAPFSFKGGIYPGVGGTCSASLAAAGTCTIVVTYNPTTSGSYTDTIRLSYTDGAANQSATRNVSGSAVTPAALSISDGATFDFGSKTIGISTDKTFTVTNSGESTATSLTAGTPGLSAPFSFKGGSYPGTGGTCSSSLAGNSSCTVVVTFAPDISGVTSDVVRLSFYDGSTTQTATRNVTGTGLNPALLTISDGATYDFGIQTVSSSTDKTFTLTNSGGSTATSITEGTPALVAPFSFKGGTYPGTGGTCGATLTASSTCTVVVTYNPTSAGSYSKTLRISYIDGVTTQAATRAMTGSTPAILSISDGATYDFGIKSVNTSTDKTFTVTNSGGISATSMAASPALSAPFSFKGGTYPGTGGTCSTSLAASGTCTVVVTYNPTSAGSYSGTLTVSYSDGNGTQSATRAMTGSTPAILSISDGATYDYGVKNLNTSTDKTFTVTNSGGISATSMAASPALSAPFSFKGGTYPGTGGTCSTSLAASGTCTVIVTYNPTSAGSYSGTLTVSYSDGNGTQSATRAMTGSTPAILSISDGATYDFGTQVLNSSTDKTFTVSNSGGTGATSMSASPALSAPINFKGGTYPGTGGTCSTSLAASGTCTVVVTYNPTSSGSYSKTLSVSYNDGLTTQTTTRAMTGSTPAVLSISDGATYAYGTKNLNTSTDKTFTITNSGGVSATSIAASPALSAPFSFKGGTYPGTGGTCSTSLAASGTCTVVVTYSPTSSGSYSGTLSVSYNDGVTTQSATRAMTGSTPAVLSISDGATYDYGNIANSYSADKTFTVSNSGGAAATSMASGSPSLSAPFSFKGGSYPGTGGTCAGALGISASCNIVVTYAPTSSGASSDTVRVAYNDGITSQTATRDVTGTAPAAGTLDTSFNSTGTVTASISSVNLQVNGMAFQSDGKIVVAGSYQSGSTTDFMLARFTSAGVLDTSFGSSGITRTAIGSGTNDDAAYALVIDSSDKIYLAGRTLVSASTYNWAVARYTSSGSLDTSFNSGGAIPGVVTTSTATLGGLSGGTSEARGLVIDPSGNITVVGFVLNTGNTRNYWAIARYTTAGALDTTFNSTGTMVIGWGNAGTGNNGSIARGVLVDTANSNKIVLGGQYQGSNLNFGVSRMSSDGSGETHSSSSLASSSNDIGTCVAIDSNNKVLIGGYTGSNAKFGVIRYQANSNSKDTSNFNSGGGTYAGTKSFNVGNAATKDDKAYAISVDTSDRVLLAGKAKNNSGNYDFAVARVTTAGALDTSFNSTGYKTYTVTASVDNSANGMKIDSSGRIVMAGTTTVSGDLSIAIIRVWP